MVTNTTNGKQDNGGQPF